MKLLTSSHSSSPSSSFTLSLNQSFKSANKGCVTAIMQRILCSGGLPTHSSDQIIELDSMQSGKVQELTAKQKITKAASGTTLSPPGNVVAGLMGLDLMIEIPSKAKNSTSLSRSKSMNCVDYLEECKSMKGLRRRVKSSSSFHEEPTFHLFENGNFLVLSFEGRSESKELKSKGRKKEKGYGELMQKQRERCELKNNKRENVHYEKKGNLSKRVYDMSSFNVGNGGQPENIANTSLLFKVSSAQKEYIDSDMARFSQSLKCKEVHNGEKVKKRKKKKKATCYTEKKVETECSSEDLSPVSVFDFEREAPETDVDSFGVGLGWRRKLSPELESDQHFILNSDSNFIIEEGEVKTENEKNHERSKKKEKHRQEGVDIWGEICRLVEDELVGSNQLKAEMRKQSDLESISADFASEIFDHMLNELIDQLVGSPLKTLQLQNLQNKQANEV